MRTLYCGVRKVGQTDVSWANLESQGWYTVDVLLRMCRESRFLFHALKGKISVFALPIRVSNTMLGLWWIQMDVLVA
jgi:hypothetical protein